MTDFRAEIQSYFSLEPLKEYNPDDPADMAQILVGTYAVNSQAIAAATDRHEAYIRDADTNQSAAGAMRAGRNAVLGIFARTNLDEAARLLDGRSVACLALDAADDPIRYQGIHSGFDAFGWPNLEAGNPMNRLAPYNGRLTDTNILRLFPHIPFRANHDRKRYSDVTMVHPETHRPLVTVEIGRRESAVRRLGHATLRQLRGQD